jgi:hypothetical protein
VTYRSAPHDLALHGVRVLGFPTTSRVAARYGVRQSSFAGSAGWSVTEPGRAENERRLAVELDRAGARDTVAGVHAAFVPLNRRFAAACTDWQVRPTRADPTAVNDHTDWRWDERVLRTLASVDGSFRPLCGQLADCLARFDGYADRYAAALRKVGSGQRPWVDAIDRDSLHLLWIQFHEDLLATLGIPRGLDA